jgi:hypothetical protein
VAESGLDDAVIGTLPDGNWAPVPLEGVAELRVHGVGGRPPSQVRAVAVEPASRPTGWARYHLRWTCSSRSDQPGILDRSGLRRPPGRDAPVPRLWLGRDAAFHHRGRDGHLRIRPCIDAADERGCQQRKQRTGETGPAPSTDRSKASSTSSSWRSPAFEVIPSRPDQCPAPGAKLRRPWSIPSPVPPVRGLARASGPWRAAPTTRWGSRTAARRCGRPCPGLGRGCRTAQYGLEVLHGPGGQRAGLLREPAVHVLGGELDELAPNEG